MPEAPDEIAAGSRSAGRRSAAAIIGILVLLLVAAIASYIYSSTREDAEQKQAAVAATGGDPGAAADAIRTYGCGGCHVVPGIPGARGQIGPDLGGVARRVYVGGVVTNTPDNLVNFIVDPRSIDPKSAMPRTGITPAEARNVAAYLYALR